MPLKSLKLWCELSIASFLLLTCGLPSRAATETAKTLSEAKEIAETQAGVEKDNSFLQAQNLPAPPQQPPQTDPNRDRFPQPAPSPFPLPSQPQPPVDSPPTQPPSDTPASQTIEVKKINVTGSTVFGPAQFDPIIQKVEGRTATIEELRTVADAITQLYLDKGYITSRAILVDQTIQDGVVEIRVIEGRLARIEIEGTRRLNPNYIRSRVLLGAGTPLNTAKLEDQLRLLRADPLFKNIEASLRAGEQVGESVLIVRATEARAFEGSVGADNYSPPSVGSERLGINLGYRNLTGLGDQISGSYYRTTTGGADIADLTYRIPLNAMNGTLQLRVAPNRNRVTQEPFRQFDIRGRTELYDISFRQPFIRSPREELALSLGFTYQDGQTFTFAGPTPFGFGPDINGNSRTRVFKFGQDYLRRDVAGAWAVRSLFSLGTGLLNGTTNDDPIPDARFFNWLGQIQRVQVLNKDNFLIVQADVQLSPNSLLPSQQFVVGGGQSVRGYRQNVRSGDNGIRFSVEDRFTVIRDESGLPTFQLAPFFDLGQVWNKSDNPNLLPRQRFIAGVGLGLIWQPLPRMNVRLDYGYPIINLDDRGENAQDNGLYFSINYQL